jgi:hypothetical protein
MPDHFGGLQHILGEDFVRAFAAAVKARRAILPRFPGNFVRDRSNRASPDVRACAAAIRGRLPKHAMHGPPAA